MTFFFHRTFKYFRIVLPLDQLLIEYSTCLIATLEGVPICQLRKIQIDSYSYVLVLLG
jgi:hypothetical protein